MSETISSTFGYGLNVNASKAASNTTVTVTWEQPYNPANKIPRVYRRGNKSDDWDKVANPTQSNEKTMSVDITYGPNDTNTYEYAVVYNNSEFDETYLEKLASDFDTENSPKELKCKGYTLSLPQGFITASHGTGYQEVFDWTDSTYDFNNRNIGPDYYEIQILNKNKATGWTAIGKIKIDKDNNYDSRKADKDTTDTLQNSTKVKFVSSDAYQAIFEPEFNSDNITTGQMQVLRDYKHYYRLVAVKMIDNKRIEAVADIHKNTDGTEVPAYAIRDIKDEELMRCISLIIADAINQAGINDGGNAASTNGKTGKFTINHPGASKTIKWGTEGNDYQHIFRSGLPYDYAINMNNSNYKPEEFVSPFIISLAEVEERSCADGNKLYCLPEGSITIKNELNNTSYGLKSKLTFKMGERGHNGLTVLSDGVKTTWTVTITYNSKTLSVPTNSANKENYKKLFPFDIGGDHKNKVTTYKSSLPEYQSPWWEESSQGGN